MLSRMLQACRSAGLVQHLRRGPVLLSVQAAAQRQLSCAAVQQCMRHQQLRQQAVATAAAGRWRHQSTVAAPPTRGKRSPASASPKAAAAGADAAGSSDDEEEDEEDADMIGELGEEEEGEGDWEEAEDDSCAPALADTGGVAWGQAALEVVQRLLQADGPGAAPELRDLQLFSFRAIPSSKRLDIRLDKTTDRYGSPSLEDVAAFSRLFTAAYEAALGEAAAGEVEVEVSSPGAERQVRVPSELPRFRELPMKVEFSLQEDQVDTKVLSFSEHDEAAGVTRWRLADVRINRTGGKGRGLNRKQRDTVIELPVAAIRRVNLYVDL